MNRFSLLLACLVSVVSFWQCKHHNDATPIQTIATLYHLKVYEDGTPLASHRYGYGKRNAITIDSTWSFSAGRADSILSITRYNYDSLGFFTSKITDTSITSISYYANYAVKAVSVRYTDSTIYSNVHAVYEYAGIRPIGARVRDPAITGSDDYLRFVYGYSAGSRQRYTIAPPYGYIDTLRYTADSSQVIGYYAYGVSSASYTYTYLLYADSLKNKPWMRAIYDINRANAFSGYVVNPFLFDDGNAAQKFVDLQTVSTSNGIYPPKPAATYSASNPIVATLHGSRARIVRHEVRVGNRIYVYYTRE